MTWPAVKVELGFGLSPGAEYLITGDTQYGRLGLYRVAGQTTSWVDVSAWVLSIKTKLGGEDPNERLPAGSAHVVFNNRDGRFTSDNLTGPYVIAGQSLVQPMVAIRITVAAGYNGGRLFTGWVDNWDPDLSDDLAPRISAQCIDKVGMLNAKKDLTGAHEVDPESYQFQAVMNDVNHSWGINPLGMTTTVMSVGTYEVDAARYFRQMLESCDATMQADQQANFIVHGRKWETTATRGATTQQTYANDGTGIPYDAIDAPLDREMLENSVSMTALTGQGWTPAEQRQSNDASITKYGSHSQSYDPIMVTNDIDVLALARWRIANRKDLRRRVKSLVIKPGLVSTNPWGPAWIAVADAFIGDRILVKYKEWGAPSQDLPQIVRGIEHDISYKHWVTTFHCVPVTATAVMLTGDPARGVSGTVNRVA